MVFVTAELGTNWKGNFDILERMATACKDAGVDAVKMQALSEDLLKRHIELDYYRDASVNEKNVDMIHHILRDVGINWYCSVTYPEAVDYLEKYSYMYKIRVHDNENLAIIDKCAESVQRLKKSNVHHTKLIISSQRPVPQSIYDRHPDIDIVNLYCIPRYPTPWGETNFNMLKNPEFEGYSNHCRNPLALLKAARMGAKYLEFHLTDNSDEYVVDNPVSLSYSEMREVMQWIKR